MRHRSPRPLLDIWRWRPFVPGCVRRVGSTRRKSTGLAVVSVVTLAGVLGVVVTATQIDDGASRSVTAPEPPASRTGFPVSRGGPRSPVPSSSLPAEESLTSPPSTTATLLPQEPASPEPSGSARLAPASSAPSATGASSSSVTVDNTAPETSATTVSPDGDIWEVVISADEPSTFACSLDGAGFESCGTTAQYTGLGPGWHTLSVRALDDAGNVDESPAVLRWHRTGGDAAAE